MLILINHLRWYHVFGVVYLQRVDLDEWWLRWGYTILGHKTSRMLPCPRSVTVSARKTTSFS
jgi:hypothetical protein